MRRVAEEKQMAINIAKEERKILIAQRKLESIRLLTELFDRIKVSRVIIGCMDIQLSVTHVTTSSIEIR